MFQVRRVYRLQVAAIFVLASVIAVGAVIAEAVGVGGLPPVWFAGLWIAALAWNAYWFLFRSCDRLEITSGELRWPAPLRSGIVPLADLTEVKPQAGAPQMVLIKRRGGPSLVILTKKGFVGFTDALQIAAPALPIRMGLTSRISEKLPGPRGWK